MTPDTDEKWFDVPENKDKLATIKLRNTVFDSVKIMNLIKEDKIVHLPDITADQADDLMRKVSSKFKLHDSLELQAEFANSMGHRENIGKYYMSVNQRDNYEYITAHSEGGSFANIQLASFFCYENTTDGGENIFMNVNENTDKWDLLREQVVKAKEMNNLSKDDIAKARSEYNVTLPKDLVKSDDIILREYDCDIEGLKLADVLTKLKKTYSVILDREVYVYWDNVGSIDKEAGREYFNLLKHSGMLRKPDNSTFAELDYNSNRNRRVWDSGVKYSDVFNGKVTKKMSAGDFVIMNNLTWTHSASNWTPGTGVRKISAAFA